MPRYIPIPLDFSLQASRSDLLHFKWSPDEIAADFILPNHPQHLVRVTFNRQCIVRLVDEMPLSTEIDDTPHMGPVSEHFAYQVEGAAFARMQSNAWMTQSKQVQHYRFITGWTCMDVVSAAAPSFELIAHH